MDRETVKQRIAQKLLSKYIGALEYPEAWPTIVAAVGASTDTEKASLVEFLRQGNPQQSGVVFGRMILRELRSLAEAEADTILADDSISLTELQRIWS